MTPERSGVANIARDERGSILLAALVMISVLTLLGFALFDLAKIDDRLAMGTEAEYRALELAESALERAMYQLLLDMCGTSSCTSPLLNPSWADGDINGAALTVSTTDFQNVSGWGTSDAPLTSFGDGTIFDGLGTSQSYFVQARNIKSDLSDPTGIEKLGITCSLDASSRCVDAIYVRATGMFIAGVQRATRTIQAVIRARFNGLGSGGLTAGSPAAGTITGNSQLHGSLHIMPCPSGTCATLSFTGNTGIFNNYNGLCGPGSGACDQTMQRYVPQLKKIVCPAGTACDGLTVETLDATVRVAKPDTNTFHLGGSAEVGEPGSGSINSVTTVRGKPTVDGVYLGNGCDVADCSDQVDQPGHVYTDRPIRGYDQAPAPTFPILTNSATVFNRNYDNYAGCRGPGDCNSNGDVVAPGTPGNKDFFISHAARILSTTMTDQLFQCGASSCPQGGALNLLPLVSGGGWDEDTPTFGYTFSCGGGGVNCDDAGGNRINGSISGSKPDGFQIEWNKDSASKTLSIYQCPVGQGVACGSIWSVTRASGGNISSDTRRYRVAYLDGTGAEFQVSVPVSISVPNNSSINVQAEEGPTPATVSRRLYRFRTSDRTWRQVACLPVSCGLGSTPAWNDNVRGTLSIADNVSDATLGSQPVLTAALNEGLLSDAAHDSSDAGTFEPTLPVLIYVDGRLKICEDCNSSKPPFYFRGNAILLVKGDPGDTPTSTNGSIVVDTDFLPACAARLVSGAWTTICPDNTGVPNRNLFRFYTPGNVFMSATGGTAQRNHIGEYYAGGKWKTTKQTNVVGTVTAQVFDMGSQVPKFWQAGLPHTQTAFPPTGPRWGLSRVRWKECVGAIPSGAC
jgi:Tfp pilus assembly protein PilX